MNSETVRILEGGVADIARVEPLWRSMVEFHREVSSAEWPVRTGQDAWGLRRAQYREWLAGEGCWLLLALKPDVGPDPCGYAVLRLVEFGPTWDLGEQIGEIESLAVAEDARGDGVGTVLIEAARERLLERGIHYWSVGVVEKNEGATRLYRRHGFRNYYRQLLGRVDQPGS